MLKSHTPTYKECKGQCIVYMLMRDEEGRKEERSKHVHCMSTHTVIGGSLVVPGVRDRSIAGQFIALLLVECVQSIGI